MAIIKLDNSKVKELFKRKYPSGEWNFNIFSIPNKNLNISFFKKEILITFKTKTELLNEVQEDLTNLYKNDNHIIILFNTTQNKVIKRFGTNEKNKSTIKLLNYIENLHESSKTIKNPYLYKNELIFDKDNNLIEFRLNNKKIFDLSNKNDVKKLNSFQNKVKIECNFFLTQLFEKIEKIDAKATYNENKYIVKLFEQSYLLFFKRTDKGYLGGFSKNYNQENIFLEDNSKKLYEKINSNLEKIIYEEYKHIFK